MRYQVIINLLALVLGICISVIIIMRFKTSRLENSKSAYAILLFTFPLYYFLFAMLAKDFAALLLEVAVGSLFFTIAFFALRLVRMPKFGLLAFGYILHGIYDVVHNLMFINAGTPDWWPAFCAVIDIIIGVYLVYLAYKHRASFTNSESQHG